MTISGLTRTLTAAAAGGALLATGLLTTSPAQAGAGRGAGVMTGAPTLGTCSTMTVAQAGAKTDRSTVVPCAQAHSAFVADVVRLPSSVAWNTASNKDLYRVVARRCAPDVLKQLGPSSWARADMTAFDYVWFEPTPAEQGDGARWLSCSIVLRHGAKLADLPVKRPPFVRRGKVDDTIARCLTESVLRTTCSGAHAWRATGTFSLRVAERPTARSLDKTADRRCLPLVDRHKKYFRFTYPNPIVWAESKDHAVVCYSQSRK